MEAQDPLLLKTTTAGSSNVTVLTHKEIYFHPGSWIVATLSQPNPQVEDCETEEDSGPKPDGEKETESSAEEDMGMLGEVGNVYPSLGYIAWFANMIELHQKKNCNCFRYGSPDHLVKDCPKELGKTARKVGLNLKEGMVKNGGCSSQKLVATQQVTLGDAPQAYQHLRKLPSWSQTHSHIGVGLKT